LVETGNLHPVKILLKAISLQKKPENNTVTLGVEGGMSCPDPRSRKARIGTAKAQLNSMTLSK